MPSSYTTRNRLEKQAAGENNNSWGTLLNTLFDLVDTMADGMVSFTGNKTLTTANGTADEARARYLNITGGTTATVTIPNLEKVYLVRNAGSGAATITTGSGTTATVPAGTQAIVVCEGGNVCRAFVIADPTAAVTASGAWTVSGVWNFTAVPTINGTNIFASEISVKNEAYTLVLTDYGKTIYHSEATTARTYTIPANASVAFPVGSIIIIKNKQGSGAITLAITTDTLHFGASGTGSRTIAAGGRAVIQKMETTVWDVSGSGIT